jgi:hypothetical protein
MTLVSSAKSFRWKCRHFAEPSRVQYLKQPKQFQSFLNVHEHAALGAPNTRAHRTHSITAEVSYVISIPLNVCIFLCHGRPGFQPWLALLLGANWAT